MLLILVLVVPGSGNADLLLLSYEFVPDSWSPYPVGLCCDGTEGQDARNDPGVPMEDCP